MSKKRLEYFYIDDHKIEVRRVDSFYTINGVKIHPYTMHTDLEEVYKSISKDLSMSVEDVYNRINYCTENIPLITRIWHETYEAPLYKEEEELRVKFLAGEITQQAYHLAIEEIINKKEKLVNESIF